MSFSIVKPLHDQLWLKKFVRIFQNFIVKFFEYFAISFELPFRLDIIFQEDPCRQEQDKQNYQ